MHKLIFGPMLNTFVSILLDLLKLFLCLNRLIYIVPLVELVVRSIMAK